MFRRNISLSVLAMISLSFPLGAQDSPNAPISVRYRKWLSEDVRWILTADERKEFRSLVTDDQRDKFIVDFWETRNPHPGDKENAFKQEHYRRLAFANERFAGGIEGSKTDRGGIYIIYGPPDAMKTTSPATASPPKSGCTTTTSRARETRVSLTFVDECRCGAYELKNHADLLRVRTD
jgi:GWxTD domain-containing protein